MSNDSTSGRWRVAFQMLLRWMHSSGFDKKKRLLHLTEKKRSAQWTSLHFQSIYFYINHIYTCKGTIIIYAYYYGFVLSSIFPLVCSRQIRGHVFFCFFLVLMQVRQFRFFNVALCTNSAYYFLVSPSSIFLQCMLLFLLLVYLEYYHRFVFIDMRI